MTKDHISVPFIKLVCCLFIFTLGLSQDPPVALLPEKFSEAFVINISSPDGNISTMGKLWFDNSMKAGRF